MRRPNLKIITLLFAISSVPGAASATSIDVGIFSFDGGVLQGGGDAFDITNGTGANASLLGFPVTTPVSITVTSLIANKSGGGSLTVNGSDFTVVDPEGDVNCAVTGDAGSGGCDFAAYTLSSAVLTGFLSPTTGLAGLPSGFTGIQSPFTAILTPSSGLTLSPGDFVNIQATLVAEGPVSAVPEPPTAMLLDIGLIGWFARYKLNRLPLLKRLRTPRA